VDALAAIVGSSDDAIYSKDANAVITSWNAAAERLYGYAADEIIGRPIEVLIPDSKKGEELDILSQILRGQRVHHYKTQRVRKNGDLVDVSIAVSPVHDSEGRVVQAAVIARNITDQLRLERVLANERNTRAKIDRKRALELNDEVVQALAVAKMAFETGQHEKGLRAVTSALERAKAVVASLLAEHGQEAPIQAGDLVRDIRTEDAD
jgi:PAS domain S-box-containing protein